MPSLSSFWKHYTSNHTKIERNVVASLGIIGTILMVGGIFISSVPNISQILANAIFAIGLQLLGTLGAYLVIDQFLNRNREMGGATHQGINYNDFIEKLNNPKLHRVRIVMTAMDFLLNSPRDEDKQLKEKFLSNLKKISENGCNIQLLFLDPFSFAAYHREEGYLREQENIKKDKSDIESEETRLVKHPIPRQIKENLKILHDWREELEGDVQRIVEIKVFDALPPFVLFQTNDFGDVVFFRRAKPVRDALSLSYYDGTALSEYINKTFDYIWNDSVTTRSLERYINIAITVKNGSKEKPFEVKYVKSRRKFLLKEEEDDEPKRIYLLYRQSDEKELDDFLRSGTVEVQLTWKDQKYKANPSFAPSGSLEYQLVAPFATEKYIDPTYDMMVILPLIFQE